MTILGHGLDIVLISEFEPLMKIDDGSRSSRCFSSSELEEAGSGTSRLDTLAGKFAAKEAVSKALGSGIGAGISLVDIEILRAPGAKPEVKLSGFASLAAGKLGIRHWHLSISHAGDLATASVIASC